MGGGSREPPLPASEGGGSAGFGGQKNNNCQGDGGFPTGHPGGAARPSGPRRDDTSGLSRGHQVVVASHPQVHWVNCMSNYNWG